MEEGEPGGARRDGDQGLEIAAAHAQGLSQQIMSTCFASGSRLDRDLVWYMDPDRAAKAKRTPKI
jgi:hypothetical protein